MATFRKRGDRWQVQVRRQGQSALSRSFVSKADAQRWARHMEAKLDGKQLPSDYKRLDTTTLEDILVRYRKEIVPTKRGQDIETIIIEAFLRNPIAKLTLNRLTSEAFASYRDMRLDTVQPSTLLRELGIIQHALDIAAKEWGIPTENPVKSIRKPRLGQGRDRRVTPEEEALLLAEAGRARNPLLRPAIILALETGMRRGEMLAMRWEDLDLSSRLLMIPQTKNGHSRRIPLTTKASATLRELYNDGHDRPLPMSAESLKKGWQRILTRSGIEGLRFHDLRHEAISRFFERDLSMPEVALISGHRDPRMLFRYTHLKAENLLDKIG